MSWNEGAGIFGELIWVAQKEVPDDEARKAIYEHMIDAFVDAGCDTLSECLGGDSVFDEVYGEKYPDEVEEDDDESPEELDFED